MNDEDQISRRTLRLPADALAFIEREAKRNMTSVNAEVVRSVRERQERMQIANAKTAGEPVKTTPTV